MKNLIRKYPLSSFIIITLLYSWTLWLLMILSSRGLLPFRFPTNFLGSFGPAVGALIVTGICDGGAGIKSIFRSMLRFKASFKSYCQSLFLIIIVYAVTSAVSWFTNREVLTLSGLPGAGEMVAYFLIIALLGGPLGEETGWRGFLQPRLMKKFNPVVSSLLIALIWFIWHIPLFWLEGAAQAGSSMIYFGIMVLAMSFLFTILYIESNGSLFHAMLFHTMINYVSAYILPSLLPAAESDKSFGHLSTYVIAGITLIFIWFNYRRLTIWKENQATGGRRRAEGKVG